MRTRSSEIERGCVDAEFGGEMVVAVVLNLVYSSFGVSGGEASRTFEGTGLAVGGEVRAAGVC